ncbi:ATP-binding protein [Paracoccus caeni]|uniref:ATP-binding protein n=1 Tax=Paracoccus caeni TaxID=657651 RepID=A0A934SJI9_9RHOB|nr:ATP-binding protein [Paracoccus caeni]MBK4216502.1 ATP-binding protein [Paracoccus caeni]
MLRTILDRGLSGIDGAEIVTLPANGPFDAVLLCADRPDLGLLETGQTQRLVIVTRRGDRMWVAGPDMHPHRFDDFSPDILHSALIDDPRPVQIKRGGFRRWFGRSDRSQPPLPAIAPPKRSARLAPLNAWLAGRVLDNRGASLPVEGAALLESLARSQQGQPLQAPSLPGLDRIAAEFGLDPPGRELLLLASLVEVSPEAARLVALLGGGNHLTLGRVADIGHDPIAFLPRLQPGAPLIDYGLIRIEPEGPLINRRITAPADVVAYALGQADVTPFPLRPLYGTPPPLSEVVSERVAVLSRLLAERRLPPDAAFIVTGPVDGGRGDVARVLAASTATAAVELDAAALTERAVRNDLRRMVQLYRTAVILTVPEEGAEALDWTALLRGLGGHVFLIAAPSQFAALAVRLGRQAVPVDLPGRDRPQRAELWRQAMPSLTDDERDLISERFDLGRKGVERALGLAVTAAQLQGRSAPDQQDLISACDRLRIADFRGTAQRLDCDLCREDIVLRPETEAEIDLAIAWARHGAGLFDTGGAGSNLQTGRGLACLFTGPPGTGKSMAARIVAREVDYALYRIDISQVVDKFIGESEKRLATLFDEAERSRVALFFDEADCVFGKRTELRDSHDRYANITVDFLLQRLESFEGLAILATNLAGNMDDAFLRRLRVRAEFAPPGPDERRRIWEKLLPAAEQRAGDIDLNFLSHSFQIVGGEIRNAIYTAHLLAAAEGQQLAMRHCVRGLWRELGKIGRLSDRGLLGPWRQAIG